MWLVRQVEFQFNNFTLEILVVSSVYWNSLDKSENLEVKEVDILPLLY